MELGPTSPLASKVAPPRSTTRMPPTRPTGGAAADAACQHAATAISTAVASISIYFVMHFVVAGDQLYPCVHSCSIDLFNL